VGDVTDRALAVSLLQEFRPTVLVLNAGAKPPMGPLHGRAEFWHHSFRPTNPTTIFAWAPMRFGQQPRPSELVAS
jgi:hypothetical protein